MSKLTFLRLSLIALLGTAGFVAFLLTRPGSPINRQNFEKIQVGMTLAEVEAIIGLPQRSFLLEGQDDSFALEELQSL